MTTAEAHQLKDAFAVDGAGIEEALTYLGEEFYVLGMPAVLEQVEGGPLKRAISDPGDSEHLRYIEQYLKDLAKELIAEEARIKTGKGFSLSAQTLGAAKQVLDKTWRVFKASVK